MRTSFALLAAFALLLPLREFCQTPPASNASPARPPAFYGVNADPVWDFKAIDPKSSELPLFVKMLKGSGAGSVRLPIRWRVLEPRKGEWDFAAVDRVLEAIPAGVEVLGLLMSVPQWANGMDPKTSLGWFDAYPPKDLADWERAVSTIVARYKGRVKHWEIWNEQNGVDFFRPLPDAKAYTKMLKISYQSAKKADPGCVVVLGGLQMNGIIANPWSDVKVEHFLEDLYKAGARPYFDVCNIHPYALPEEGAGRTVEMTRDTLALMNRYGDAQKPVWLTEVGCGAPTPEAEEIQARLVRDTYVTAAREPRIQRVFWFTLRDMEKDLLGPESSMGLFKHRGAPKPALEAFTAAAKASSDQAIP